MQKVVKHTAASVFLGSLCLVAQAQGPLTGEKLEQRVQELLSQMTLEEKCRLSYAQSKFSSPGVPRLGVPELWTSDGPHGVRMEINWNDWGHSHWTNDSVTVFPALTCLAATWNPDMALLYGQSVGEEARYRKKNVLLGPGVNIYRTPLNGRNFEYMGEDPYLSSEMCVPYIIGLQQNGVGACLKHYILNDQEEYRGHVDVRVSDRALYEIYLPAFKAAVQRANVWSIMGSYNCYKGQHNTHNDILINKILKGEFGFKGAIISDWGATHDTREAALCGLDLEMGSYTNGLTSESKGFTYEDYYLGKAYLQMCKRGEIPDSVINDKAARMLRLLLQTSPNAQLAPGVKPSGALNSPEHLAAARAIGDEGVVLLKNGGVLKGHKPAKGACTEALLPIDVKRYKKILVVGENAVRCLSEGGGSSELKPRDEVSPLRGLKARFGAETTIEYAEGYVSGPSMYGRIIEIPTSRYDSLRADAVAKAKEADLIIYIGGLNKNHFQDCEGGDRLGYELPFHQDELINALLDVQPRMVMVLISGNAVEMPWIDRVPSLVQSWYVGSQAGPVLADILSGDVNPSGKTVFSYPVRLEDCPAHYYGLSSYPGVHPDSLSFYNEKNPGKRNTSANSRSHHGKGNEAQVYAEDIFVGYRWYDTMGKGKDKWADKRIHLLFPFGYGLSYTTFQYGKPSIDGTRVTVAVKNTGSVAGKEVVQFYVGDDQASVKRPRKELKYFKKVSLAPGEEKTVTYDIKPEDLKFFDEAKHDWVSEPGTFHIYVCASSADERGSVVYELK